MIKNIMWFLQKRNRDKHLGDSKKHVSSSTFCMLPWVHLHALPNGNVLPCCVAPYEDAFANLESSSLDKAWNSEKLKKLRVNMINDVKSESCQRCYEIESYGGMSLRKQMNEVFSEDYDLVYKTKKDGTLKKFKMLYLDIRFSNICNLKCMGCSPALSSKWQDDFNKLYNKEKKTTGVIKITNLSDLFMEELICKLKDVKRAYFAGGEPLLMEEHYQCLDYFIKNKQENLQLTYNTNLMLLHYRDYNVLDYWKKFNFVSLSISIDDISERGEYFRFGTNWLKLVENIKNVIRDCPHVKIEVTCTVSLFNIGRLPEIHSYLYSCGFINEEGLYLNYMLDPKHLRSQNLPIDIKEIISKKLNDYIKKLKSEYPEKSWKILEQQFKKQIDFLNGESDIKNIESFRKIIPKLDSIRKSNIKSSYPEIALSMGLNDE